MTAYAEALHLPLTGNRRVRMPSSRDTTLALCSSIHATRLSCLTASTTASQFFPSASAAGRPGAGAAAGPVAAGTLAGTAGLAGMWAWQARRAWPGGAMSRSAEAGALGRSA